MLRPYWQNRLNAPRPFATREGRKRACVGQHGRIRAQPPPWQPSKYRESYWRIAPTALPSGRSDPQEVDSTQQSGRHRFRIAAKSARLLRPQKGRRRKGPDYIWSRPLSLSMWPKAKARKFRQTVEYLEYPLLIREH